MPVLEAMSYGTPCAVSDIPIFREIAGNDTAVFFKQSEPSSIASALQDLLQDAKKRQVLATKAKKHITTYSWQESARTLYEAIKTHGITKKSVS